jgi:hypothetical protein
MHAKFSTKHPLTVEGSKLSISYHYTLYAFHNKLELLHK